MCVLSTLTDYVYNLFLYVYICLYIVIYLCHCIYDIHTYIYFYYALLSLLNQNYITIYDLKHIKYCKKKTLKLYLGPV